MPTVLRSGANCGGKGGSPLGSHCGSARLAIDGVKFSCGLQAVSPTHRSSRVVQKGRAMVAKILGCLKTMQLGLPKWQGCLKNRQSMSRLPCDPSLLHPQNESRPNLPSFQAARAPKTAPKASEAEVRQIIEREMIRSRYLSQRAANGTT